MVKAFLKSFFVIGSLVILGHLLAIATSYFIDSKYFEELELHIFFFYEVVLGSMFIVLELFKFKNS